MPAQFTVRRLFGILTAAAIVLGCLHYLHVNPFWHLLGLSMAVVVAWDIAEMVEDRRNVNPAFLERLRAEVTSWRQRPETGQRLSEDRLWRMAIRIQEFGEGFRLRRPTGGRARQLAAIGHLAAVTFILRTAGFDLFFGRRGSSLIGMAMVVFFLVGAVRSLRQWLEREELWVGDREITYLCGVLARRQRRVAVAEVRSVDQSSDEDSRGQYRSPGVRIDTAGEPVDFGIGLAEDERLWLVDLLRSRLRRGQSFGPSRPAEELLVPGAAPQARPRETRWEVTRHGNDLVIGKSSGRAESWLSAASAGLALLLFVGFFADNWSNAMRGWSDLVVEVVFGIASCVLLVVCLSAIVRPFVRSGYDFGSRGIRRHFCILGLHCSRPVTSDRIEQIRVCRPSQPNEKYRLVFIGQDGRELLRIDNLNEAESRWLGDESSRVVGDQPDPIG